MPQQQPKRDRELQEQQRSGHSELQPKPGADAGGKKPQQMGEGSYEATRDYQERIGRYMDKADVEADAKAAKPRSADEARELERAEREGQSRSKGES